MEVVGTPNHFRLAAGTMIVHAPILSLEPGAWCGEPELMFSFVATTSTVIQLTLEYSGGLHRFQDL